MNDVTYHEDRCRAVVEAVPGYSGAIQYNFFQRLLAFPKVNRVLMLGVYHGRDLCFIGDIAKDYSEREFTLVGVDKFEDAACADWPEGKVGMNWREAGYGRPPSHDSALENLRKFCGDNVRFELYKQRDREFLELESRKFDLIYLDTSHDYETVRRQLGQIGKLCHETTLICGDDYSDEGNQSNWGVKSAVKDSFTNHLVFGGWIWMGKYCDLIP